MKLVELAGLVVEATSGAPVVILREHDAPHRLLPIFVGGPEAAAIAVALSGQSTPRPLTHDLMAALVRGLDGHVDALEVTEVNDGAFHARLALHGPAGEQRLDTRPSDGIALAVRLGAPLFVSDEVLDEAGTVSVVDADEAAIDEAVHEFRSFLDEVDPSSFADVGLDIAVDRSADGADETESGSADGEMPTTDDGTGVADDGS